MWLVHETYISVAGGAEYKAGEACHVIVAARSFLVAKAAVPTAGQLLILQVNCSYGR